MRRKLPLALAGRNGGAARERYMIPAMTSVPARTRERSAHAENSWLDRSRAVLDAPALGRWLALAVFGAAFLLCALTFTTASDGIVLGNDVVAYARSLARQEPGALLNPHHLLFHPLAAALDVCLGWLGNPRGMQRALAAHQGVSALGAGAAAAALFAFARELCGPLRAALLSACFALCAGNWLYGSVGESYLPANAALLALLACALRMRLGLRAENATPIAVCLLLALLLRQDSVLVVPALFALLGARCALRATAIAGAAALAIYAGAWMLAAPGPHLLDWLRGLERSGLWGAVPDARAARASLGLTAAAFNYVTWFDLSLGLMSIGLFALPLLPPRHLTGGFARALAGLGLYALLHFAFFTWWQPGNMEYATGRWVPLFLAAALLLAPDQRGWRALRQPMLLGSCAWLLWIGNSSSLIRPFRATEIALRAQHAIHLAGEHGAIVALDWQQRYALWREEPAQRELIDASELATRFDAASAAALRARIDVFLASGRRVVLTIDRVLPRKLKLPVLVDAALLEVLTRGLGTTEVRDEANEIYALQLRPAGQEPGPAPNSAPAQAPAASSGAPAR